MYCYLKQNFSTNKTLTELLGVGETQFKIWIKSHAGLKQSIKDILISDLLKYSHYK